MSNYSRIYLPDEVAEMIAYDIPKKYAEKNYAGNLYYEVQTVIDYLNATFTPFGWDFEILEDKDVKTVECFKKDGKPYPQGTFLSIKGRLTVKLIDKDFKVLATSFKEQYGSADYKNGITEQDSTFKVAASDCLKKCAMQFGIGANLKRNNDEQEDYLGYMLPNTEEQAEEYDNEDNENNDADVAFEAIDKWTKSDGVDDDVISSTLELFNESLEEPIENINYKTICNDDEYVVMYYNYLLSEEYITE